METIYAIRSGSYIKIGITSGNLESRMSSLQTGNPHKLKISFARALDVGRCGLKHSIREVEAEIHRRLENWRAEGEWFMITPRDAEKKINEVVDEMMSKPWEPSYSQVKNSRIVSIPVSGKVFSHLTRADIFVDTFISQAISEKLKRDELDT